MAATALVISLRACVRYWPDRGWVFECATCFYCCYEERDRQEGKAWRIKYFYKAIFATFPQANSPDQGAKFPLQQRLCGFKSPNYAYRRLAYQQAPAERV